MPSTEFLYRAPFLLIESMLLALLLLVLELSFRAGMRARSRTKEVGSMDLGPIQGGVLGLLGLLLAFTYAFAADRHHARKQMVTREANAIGTAYLRAGLFPEPGRAEVRSILREYLDSRLVSDEIVRDPDRLLDAIRRSEGVLARLWPAAALHLEGRPSTSLDGLLMQSLNEVIDLHTERLRAGEDHVPDVIFLLLFLVAIIAMAVIGVSCGLNGHRNLFFTATLAVLITAVIAVIIDLDRPRRGFIRISQRSLLELREDLQAEPAGEIPPGSAASPR